jgi:hypothetical protein
LRAEVNILGRGNERLKAQKAADEARAAALQQEVQALQQQLADAGVVADKLRAELGERDGVISDNYTTLQGLRRRVQELEAHKFVLTYKVCVGWAGEVLQTASAQGISPCHKLQTRMWTALQQWAGNVVQSVRVRIPLQSHMLNCPCSGLVARMA